MGKDIALRNNPSYKHLVDFALGKNLRVDKSTRLADVSLEEFKAESRKVEMVRKLNNWCADVDVIKREIRF